MIVKIRKVVHILNLHPQIGTERIVGSLRPLIFHPFYFIPLLLDILDVFEAFFLLHVDSSRNVLVFHYIAADIRKEGVRVIRSIFDRITTIRAS